MCEVVGQQLRALAEMLPLRVKRVKRIQQS
jgi:hypothetical protein